MMTWPHRIPPRRSALARGWRAALSCLLLLALGCGHRLPGEPKAADRPIPDDKSLSFDVLFRRNCAGCHGADGRLGPAPPLNDPIFLAIVPDAELSRVIQAGRRGTPMPAFAHDRGGPLTGPQLNAIVEGIKSRWKPSAPSSGPLPDYLLSMESDPPSASQDHQRGADVFARACAGCHGGRGEGTQGKSPVGAVNDPAFLALISDQALRRIIITGRPDLKMPNFAGDAGRAAGFQALNSTAINDLVALLASWRRGDQVDAPP